MKKLLSKIFFASDCAKGATFALTLFTLGNCVCISLFHFVMLWMGEPSMSRLLWAGATPTALRLSAGGVLMITIYSFALAVISLVGLVKVLRRKRRFKALWHLVPAGVCLALGTVVFLRVFPPVYLIAEIGEKISNPSLFPYRLVSGGIPGLPPEYWAAIFFLSLLVILAGGLFLAATFAAAEGKKFRSAFGRATLSVWGIFAVWYISTLGLAYRESRACSAVRQAVEKRFGHPLTAAGLEELYRENGKIDTDFWPRHEKLRAALPKVKIEEKDEDGEARTRELVFADIALPDRPSEATLAWYTKYCRTNRAAIEKYENCFDSVPPLPERRFVRGEIVEIALGELPLNRNFVRSFERSRLICHLAAKDADAAWACYRRMGNVGAYLQKETFLIGSLVWLHVEHKRLDCVEKLLESRLLADAKLDELDADLAALERDIPRNHRQAMYTEAVFGQDFIASLEDGRFKDYGNPKNHPGAFAPYRWIFPQLWYYGAKDKKTMLQIYLLPDFTHFKMDSVNQGLLLTNLMLPVLEHVGDRFYALTARVRGMRALIRAEKYRRKHGDFPKTLPDLPEAPFTGKPLVYEIGKAKITETVWKTPDRPAENENTVKTTVDAVSVRSPATLTRSLIRESKDHYEDATRALIRY